MGQEVTSVVLEFMKNGKLLGEINATITVVIPKVANPVNASQFRSISCCNVLYNIL